MLENTFLNELQSVLIRPQGLRPELSTLTRFDTASGVTITHLASGRKNILRSYHPKL